MFTFLPHGDLAEEQGHIRLAKGNVVRLVAAYTSFSDSNHWELPLLRNLLRNFPILGMAPPARSHRWPEHGGSGPVEITLKNFLERSVGSRAFTASADSEVD